MRLINPNSQRQQIIEYLRAAKGWAGTDGAMQAITPNDNLIRAFNGLYQDGRVLRRETGARNKKNGKMVCEYFLLDDGVVDENAQKQSAMLAEVWPMPFNLPKGKARMIQYDHHGVLI